jgi:hypothetical protein
MRTQRHWFFEKRHAQNTNRLAGYCQGGAYTNQCVHRIVVATQNACALWSQCLGSIEKIKIVGASENVWRLGETRDAARFLC